MLRYKIPILEALKEKGYSTYRLRKEKIFSESTIQAFRSGNTAIALKNIDTLCALLDAQPCDLLEYVKE